MDWVNLLHEAGSDSLALLSIADLAGMNVLIRADKLVIRGPHNAGAVGAASAGQQVGGHEGP